MPHPPKELYFTGMIDEPNRFDTLEIWQDFQKTVETMPDKDSSKKYLMEMAMSMAETNCARRRRKSVPVWLIKKGGYALGSVCLV